MDKRAPLRQHFKEQQNIKLQQEQHSQNVAQISALEQTLVTSFKLLIKYLDGKTTKTQVINQLKSISTPDVDKVVSKLAEVQNTINGAKLDLKPLVEAVNSVKLEVSNIPEVKFPEQKDEIKVSNLSEVKLDTTALEKAVKELKLDPKIDIKAPVVNVDKPDLKPLQDLLLDVVKAIHGIAIPEVPETNLSKLESESKEHSKQLKEANKHLKAIVEKPVGGGGGGGGHGTPYQDSTGKPMYVTLQNGAIPQTSAAFAEKITVSGSYTYIAKSSPGTAQASALWQVKRIDESVVGTTVITWADGDANFDNVATNLTVLSYS